MCNEDFKKPYYNAHIHEKYFLKNQLVKEFHLLGRIGCRMFITFTYVLSYAPLCPICLLLCPQNVPSYVPHCPTTTFVSFDIPLRKIDELADSARARKNVLVC